MIHGQKNIKLYWVLHNNVPWQVRRCTNLMHQVGTSPYLYIRMMHGHTYIKFHGKLMWPATVIKHIYKRLHVKCPMLQWNKSIFVCSCSSLVVQFG